MFFSNKMFRFLTIIAMVACIVIKMDAHKQQEWKDNAFGTKQTVCWILNMS